MALNYVHGTRKNSYRNLKITLSELFLGQLVFVTFKKDSKPISNKHRTYIRVDSFLHYEGESWSRLEEEFAHPEISQACVLSPSAYFPHNIQHSDLQASITTSDRTTFAIYITTADISIWS